VIGGYISAAVLAVSGASGILIPHQIGPVLDTVLTPGRSKAEFRVAYGAIGSFGAWALVVGNAEVFKAVGVFWLGAAAVRLLALALDRPRIDWTYRAFLVLEVAAGLAAILGSG
jgi:hypothetical protein